VTSDRDSQGRSRIKAWRDCSGAQARLAKAGALAEGVTRLFIEFVHRRHYSTRMEASCNIFAYIEAFHKRTRRHSAIGYSSLVEIEQKADRPRPFSRRKIKAPLFRHEPEEGSSP
jgi:transposase InsO family protein